jgi:hypothetical protein
MIMSQFLWILGSSIFALLGLAHLRITFSGKKLYPKDDSVQRGMENTHPRLTPDTTMWKAWIGFNASHSAGAIFFGVLNILLAATHFPILMEPLFLALNLLFAGFFLYLGKVYWFKIPFIGILLTLILLVVSWLTFLFSGM